MSKKIDKNYKEWSDIKSKIEHKKDNAFFPKIGEVWMINLGVNIGYEQDGSGDNFSRPVLIIKKFNNKMFWIIPLSSIQKDIDFYYNFSDLENRKVSAILSQLKLVSIKRFSRKMYEIRPEKLKEVKKKIVRFLE